MAKTIKFENGQYRHAGWFIEKTSKGWIVYDDCADTIDPVATCKTLKEAKAEAESINECC